MKKQVLAAIFLLIILISAFFVVKFFCAEPKTSTFYLGVEFAYADDAASLKSLVDKVANYTNLFVIGSLGISFNRTALDESCDYIYDSGLHFIVLFTGLDMYNWQDDYDITDWMLDAQQKYGDKFLGIYKIDEPGGNQLDRGYSMIINDTTSYALTSEYFVGNLSRMINYYYPYSPRIFTADYALNWFDYKANYSVVFGEFVGNESRERIIALNRGAATAFQRDWGVIINWRYNQEPFLESYDELYNDLSLAYNAGAKYVIVFSYPNLTDTSYGTLKEEHFEVLKNFWGNITSNPQNFNSKQAQVAYILPRDYGFGFRRADDSIWGLFSNDSLSSKIYFDIENLTNRWGSQVDILYNEPEIIEPILHHYTQVFYWNQTIE
jgi:hypothetical protein